MYGFSSIRQNIKRVIDIHLKRMYSTIHILYMHHIYGSVKVPLVWHNAFHS